MHILKSNLIPSGLEEFDLEVNGNYTFPIDLVAPNGIPLGANSIGKV